MNFIIKVIKKIIYRYKSDSKSFIKYLIKCGANIGENTYFFSPRKTTVDIQNAMFLTIGNNCKITQGVTILCHDYSYSVCRPIFHDVPKKAALTKIGNNVFIGINSIILMGADIGDNVIIGAGSVISGKIPSNEVWAGNPAKFICTIDQYHKKCVDKFEEGAKLFVKQYKTRLKRNPTINELQYFAVLFLNNNSDNYKYYKSMSFNGDLKKEVEKDCYAYKSKYNSYEDFLNNILDEKGEKDEI